MSLKEENKALRFLEAALDQEMSQSPSPLGRWLNGILRHVAEGEMAVEFTVRPEMTNPVGLLHGGAVAAIMDDTIGATIFSLGLPTFFTTINLSIDYLASAKVGDRVLARTELVRQGRTIIHAECRLYNMEGKLLAKGSTNLLRKNATFNFS